MVKALIVIFSRHYGLENFAQVGRGCSYSLKKKKKGHRTINLGAWQWVKWWTGTKATFSSTQWMSGTVKQVMWNEWVQQLHRQSITHTVLERTHHLCLFDELVTF